MTTINTIEDLARILRDQPTWAEALQSLILTQDLMEVPAKLDQFIQEKRETNRPLNSILDSIDAKLRSLEEYEYERSVRTGALGRSINDLGFEDPYLALHQDGLTDPRLTSNTALAVRDGLVTRENSNDLHEADLIISSDQDKQHAVVEVSLTADQDDINRARTRTGILAAITGGTVSPVVITSRLDPAQSAQAEALE